MYVYKSVAESRVTNAALRAISLAAQEHTVVEGGKARVSACKPLCAIFLRKPSAYSFSLAKANVGRLCEKLKNVLKNGWKIKFMAAALPTFSLLLIVGVHREPGNVCI